MSDVTLFGLPPSSYVRSARMALEMKGVDYILTPVDFRDEAYRAKHPFAKMPAMQHGDQMLFETLAIAIYVDENFDGPDLQPVNAGEKSEMFQWISTINSYVYDDLVRNCINERFVKPMRGLEPDEAHIAASKPEMQRTLEVLNDALDGRDFLAGNDVSLADIFLAPILWYFDKTPEGQEILPALTHLAGWTNRMEQIPAYAKINCAPGA